MFNKRKAGLVFLVFIFLVSLVGCGQSGDTDSKEQSGTQQGTTKEVTKPMKLTMAGRSAGGASQVIGETVGEAIKKKVSGTSFTYEPGQDGANSVTVAQGKTELGLEHALTASAAYNGTAPFTQKFDNIRAISYLLPTTYHFVVDKRSGITSFKQIKEQKIPIKLAVNTKDSVMELATRIVLKNYGITYQDIESWGGKIFYITLAQGFGMMKDKRIDAIGNVLFVPTSAVTEAATTLKLDLLPIDQDIVANIAKEVGGSPVTIQKSAYSFLEKDVPTVEANNVLVTSAEQPDDVVYTITKALYEQQEFMRKAHPSFATFKTENMTKVGDLPLHPGAKKFYQEIGLIK